MFANNMKNIFIIFFLFFITFPQEAFPLIYDKKTNKGVVWSTNEKGGRSESEGYYGSSKDFPSCSKANYKDTGLRQGKKIIYKPDGKIHTIEQGLYDCQYSNSGELILNMIEGFAEFPIEDGIQIFFKTDNLNNHVYVKEKGTWRYATKNKNYAFWSHPKANTIQRLATQSEIEHAEKLYKFYKNIDLSSRSAKIYGDKILNNDILTASSVSKTSSSSSKLPNCVGGFNEKTWTNCYGIYKWSNSGDRYEGEYLNGDRHGFGTYFYANGNKYSGEYKNDSPNGKGTMIFSSGAKYIGEVKNGKRHGSGTYFYPDGERLTGIWNENVYVDAKNYRKVENENSNFTKKTKSKESTKLKTSNSIKEYWWVLILIIGVIFFVYTQTKKDLNLNSERSFRPRARESKNFIISFFNGQESLGFSFWIMYSLLTLINFFLFSILDDYSSKQNVNALIPGIFAWIVVGCYVFSSIGTWRSATNYKLQKIRIRETFGWTNVIYVVIVATSILLGIGFIQGALEAI